MAEELAAQGRPVNRVVEAVETTPWAITEQGLDIVLAVARRENTVTVEALEAYRAKRVADAESLTVRDGVGVIAVQGPLMRYADFFTAISGGATYEGIRQDLAKAVDNPAIKAILLNVDSPGGQVNGVDELASAIRAAAAVKPVHAYVGGQGASAAYWLTAAASRVTVAQTALLGSIGVRMGIRDTSERDAKSGVRTVHFVSSQSPHKVVDHNAPEGQKKIQKTVDDLAAVFVGSVAKHRGISADAVVSKFGAGGVMVGAEAVDVGMADALGSFEDALRALASASQTPFVPGKGFRAMSTTTDNPAAGPTDQDVSRARTEGAAAAKTRIRDIMALDEAKERPALAAYVAYDTDMSPDQAKAMLGKAGKETVAVPAGAGAGAGAGADANRSRDAAGGLAMLDRTSATGTEEQNKPKARTIDAGAIYAKRNENVR